jgi:hypothetical protein
LFMLYFSQLLPGNPRPVAASAQHADHSVISSAKPMLGYSP